MVKRRYIKRMKKSYTIRYRITVVIIIIGIICLAIDLSVRPIINRAVSYQTKLITTEIITNATIEVLNELKLSYGDIITISKDSNGQITTIQTDMAAMNYAKSQIIEKITKKLNETKNYEYSIPLGTVIGNDYLINRGPLLSFMITPMGHAGGEFKSEFVEAGINQTYHRIIMCITVDTTTLIPLHNSQNKTTADFLLAETVIVGKVPSYYTNIQSDDNELKSDIGDFRINPNP